MNKISLAAMAALLGAGIGTGTSSGVSVIRTNQNHHDDVEAIGPLRRKRLAATMPSYNFTTRKKKNSSRARCQGRL